MEHLQFLLQKFDTNPAFQRFLLHALMVLSYIA
jgi:hypothetical protein